MGDPIEMSALASIFHGLRQPLWVGSVKTNIGHLEAAAGIAGMLKVILALGHETIPPHLHFRQPNPYIPWSEFPAKIPTGQVPWPRSERPRLAGVSSFGFSGTNAHVILQEAPLAGSTAGTSRACHLLPLSAKSHDSLRELAGRYLERLEQDPTLRLGDVGFTAAAGRTRFPYRLAVIAETCQQACQRLRAWLRAEPTQGVLFHVAQQTADGSILPAWPQPADLERLDAHGLVALAADRYVHGLPIDWESFYRGVDCRKIALPTYPFERQRYWLPPSRVISPIAPSVPEPVEHPLLGRRVHTMAAPELVLFETTLSPHEPRYLADHCLRDTVVLPATAYLEMAAASGRTLWPSRGIVVEQFAIHRALTVAPHESRIVQTLLTPEPLGYRVEFFSRRCSKDGSQQPSWVRHASGKVTSAEPFTAVVSIDRVRGRCPNEVAQEAVYGRIARQGWRYGPSFRLLRQAWRGTGQALGQVLAPQDTAFDAKGLGFPAPLLDACLHVIAALDETDRSGTLVPVALERYEVVGRPVPRMWSHVALRAPGKAALNSGFTVDLAVMDSDGRLIARLEGLRLQEVDPAALTSRPEGESPVGLYEPRWRESRRDAVTATDNGPGCWLLLADDEGLAEALAQRLVEKGDQCVLIRPGTSIV